MVDAMRSHMKRREPGSIPVDGSSRNTIGGLPIRAIPVREKTGRSREMSEQTASSKSMLPGVISPLTDAELPLVSSGVPLRRLIRDTLLESQLQDEMLDVVVQDVLRHAFDAGEQLEVLAGGQEVAQRVELRTVPEETTHVVLLLEDVQTVQRGRTGTGDDVTGEHFQSLEKERQDQSER
jgi:hypothetical protein